MFFNEPRNWKWMVPAGLVVVMAVITNLMVAEGGVWFNLICIPIGLGVICLIAAAMNLWLYFRSHAVEIFADYQRALNTTTITMMADSLKGMHPEAVKVLNRFGIRTSWKVRVDAVRGSRDWILEDTQPAVHFAFIEYILDHSKHGGLMSKRFLSEGSKKWDPDGIATDYEQYDQLQNWLFIRMMVTRAYGNQPAQFIPPWNAELVREVMGMEGSQELESPDEKLLIELPKQEVKQLKGPVINVASSRTSEDVPLLTDSELEAIRKENGEYDSLYQPSN